MLSQYKLRRLAARAVRVAEAHSSQPSIAMVKDIIVLSAQEFINSYETTAILQKNSLNEYKQGREAMERFKSIMTELVPALKMYIPSLTVNIDSIGVPDDMFESVSALIDMVSEVESKPEMVTTSIIPALESALTTAEKEWREAESSRVAIQESQRLLREKADNFYYHLKLFRRTLASAIGRNHYDYRKIKDTSANISDADDPAEPTPDTPTA
ncbi:hypothetical protein KKF84_08470 [Myxococcota bacterium]|nr:hypothetical protein [Myxococcota bacterium]